MTLTILSEKIDHVRVSKIFVGLSIMLKQKIFQNYSPIEPYLNKNSLGIPYKSYCVKKVILLFRF